VLSEDGCFRGSVLADQRFSMPGCPGGDVTGVRASRKGSRPAHGSSQSGGQITDDDAERAVNACRITTLTPGPDEVFGEVVGIGVFGPHNLNAACIGVDGDSPFATA
jgi:hypothetical protein